MPPVRVRVVAFAGMRELLGGAAHDLHVEEGATVADVWDELAQRYAGMAAFTESTRLARNGRIVRDAAERIEDGDELALLPPVGGG